MSLDLYHSLLDLAITQPNIDLLVKVWYDSLTLDKKDMIELNERILFSIPELRKMLGLRKVENSDFQQFVEDYDEHQYTQQCSGNREKCLKFFARKGDWRNIRKAIEKGANRWISGLQGAAEGGWKDLVDFFWEKLGEGNPSPRLQRINADIGLSAAARGGQFNIVHFFLEKGAENILPGLRHAARGGHLELVKFFIEKGANDFNSAMVHAARGGHKDLVLFFEKKGGSDWEGVLTEAAKGDHLDIVKLAIERGAKNLNKALKLAAGNNHLDIVKYLVEAGATELEDALKYTRIEMEDDVPEDDDRSEVLEYLESQIRR